MGEAERGSSSGTSSVTAAEAAAAAVDFVIIDEKLKTCSEVVYSNARVEISDPR